MQAVFSIAGTGTLNITNLNKIINYTPTVYADGSAIQDNLVIGQDELTSAVIRIGSTVPGGNTLALWNIYYMLDSGELYPFEYDKSKIGYYIASYGPSDSQQSPLPVGSYLGVRLSNKAWDTGVAEGTYWCQLNFPFTIAGF